MAEILQSKLLTTSLVARQLDCEQKTLEAWRSRGQGPPFVRVGRLIRYRREDIEAWVIARRTTPMIQTSQR